MSDGNANLTKQEKCRLLFIIPGLVPPCSSEASERYLHLSEFAFGDILWPVWWHSAKEAQQHLNISPSLVGSSGSFRYHLFLLHAVPTPFRGLARIAFYLLKGVALRVKTGKYDAIVCYGATSTGFAAAILSVFTRTPLILEIGGAPRAAFLYDNEVPRFSDKIKKFLADLLLVLVGLVSRHIRLLYPQQISDYSWLANTPRSVFHEFVPVQEICLGTEDARFILFARQPWYLKGVDVLISAFKQISDEFTDVTLRIIGHFPDRYRLDLLIGDHPRIALSKPVPHPQLLEMMRSAAVLVLPSRTEAMGRVLIEAMACGKPVIGSNVDGIPSYIEHGETGLIFASESVSDLTCQLRRILQDRNLATRMGNAGRARALKLYSESAYVSHFENMVRGVLSKPK